uniref:NADP-dependent oxidoreductase domain-containing protein n=1 Tax=Graphocephala atropunctata TaxID=36148 RepID=A0A1B6KJE7_9HEMI
MATKIKAIFLTATNMKMPVVGLGTWQNSNDGQVEAAVNTALEAGYRHIDTAFAYRNEEAVGRVLKQWIDDGRVAREELFIVTKLPRIAMHEKYVEDYLKRSLTALQLLYVDLYLIHNPVGLVNSTELLSKDKDGNLLVDVNTDLLTIWKAMEKQVDSGRSKAIGVSNFNINQLERILKIARVKPVTNQVECHLYLQQKELRAWGKAHGVTVTAYSPLGSPGTSDAIRQEGRTTKSHNPLEDTAVLRIAKTHNRSPAQVLLRHLIQSGVSVIPKSNSPDRIRQNFDVFDFELSDEEMAELNSLDRGENGRIFGVSQLLKGADRHPEYPYHINHK